MGSDVPLAVLSDRSPAAVRLLQAALRPGDEPGHRPDPGEHRDEPGGRASGPELNLLEEAPNHAHQLVHGPARAPQRRAAQAARRRPLRLRHRDARLHLARRGRAARVLAEAVERLCAEAAAAVGLGVRCLDPVRPRRRPRPGAGAVAAGRRRPSTTTWSGGGSGCGRASWWRSGELREVHHVACLLGYGASAVNPYLLFESLPAMIAPASDAGMTVDRGAASVVEAIGKGLLKMLSRMGISTMRPTPAPRSSRRSGSTGVGRRHFTGTPSRIGGVGPRRARPGGAGAPRPGLSRARQRRRAAAGWRLRLAPRRASSTSGAPTPSRCCSKRCGSTPAHGRARPATRRRQRDEATQEASAGRPTPSSPAWPTRTTRRSTLRGLLRLADGRPADAAGRGRAGGRDRQALRHRGDEPRARSPPRRTRRWPSP